MPRENVALHHFNRGVISDLALARTDIRRTAMSAETMTNWMPRVLGPMSLRPGTKYLDSTHSDNQAILIPFVYANDDKALLEIAGSDNQKSFLRVHLSDAVMTRTTVSTSITSSGFSALTGWTDNDQSGATSDLYNSSYLRMVGTKTAYAIREQEVTVAVADQGVEHAVRLTVGETAGFGGVSPVSGYGYIQIGSSSGAGDYVPLTEVATGEYSFTFTPTGNFWVEISYVGQYYWYVDSCEVETSDYSLTNGVFTLIAPWDTAKLSEVRYIQSGNYVFCACDGYEPYVIRRLHNSKSWAIERYRPQDGPFDLINNTETTLTASATTGNITVTASADTFTVDDIGRLLKIVSNGQSVAVDVTAENQWSDPIKVTGKDTARVFTITRAGTWTATVTLQVSYTSEDGPWQDVTTWTGNGTGTYDDTLDDVTAWYRIGVDTGDFTSGTVDLDLDYNYGSITGIARIISWTSTTSVGAEVYEPFGSISAEKYWYLGTWFQKEYDGLNIPTTEPVWPTAVTLTEGRLFFAGQDKVWGSVSGDYYRFDEDEVGDSGPLNRSIGYGPVASINWMLPLKRLMLGGDGAAYVCKSSSFEEPLTPTNFSIRTTDTQGSANIQAGIVDINGVYVQRGGTRLFELDYKEDALDYRGDDLTLLAPEVCKPQISRIAVQRQPDTRIHCVLSDGTVAILVNDRAEEVACWVKFSTDGTVEDVCVLPGDAGDDEDFVYYIVNRTINGSTVRYIEKWAFESDCVGGTLNHQADSYLQISQASSTTVSGLGHLEGETVCLWANGKNLGTYTVSSGAITASEEVTTGICGLVYTAQFKSTKLAYAANQGTALLQRKNIKHLGVILKDTHYQGLEYGPDFTTMDNLPLMKDGTATAADTIHSHYDEPVFEFPGHWDTDSRLCLQATAPKPCTVLAAVIGIEVNERF